MLRLLSARLVRVVATIGLTISVSLGGLAPRWPLVMVFASLIFFNELANVNRELNTSNRPGRHYEIVQRRILRLISDLAELAGGNLRLWSVDVYLRHSSFMFSIRTFRVVNFIREHTLTLTDASDFPAKIEGTYRLFSECYTEASPHLWWNEQIAHSMAGDNRRNRLGIDDNNELDEKHGVISLNPIVDHLGRKCQGLLVIHVKPESEVATTVLGVLAQSAGKRRLAEACHDIHREMSGDRGSD